MHKKHLVNGPVSADTVISVLADMGARHDAGGNTFFLGRVRADNVEGRLVRAIEYTSYGSLADSEADSIICSILEEFDDVRSVVIIHSAGTVKAGEISLLVAVSAGHRKQALEACSRTVELVKQKLPVWKKEIYDDDSHTWK